MDVSIPGHIAAIQSYDPGQTIGQLKKKWGWEKVAVLWNNENTHGVSPKALAAIKEVLQGLNYYPDPDGRALRKRIAIKYGRQTEQVLLGNGSESILMMAIRALCDTEDEFLTSEGTFAIMYNWARINQVRPVQVPLTEKYAFDLETFKRRINRSTKVIYLANVNNPTGTMINAGELENFLQVVPEHIVVILDEAYIEYSKELATDFPDSLSFERPNILTVRSFSKAYGIAGARLGYAIGDENILEAMRKTKLTFEPNLLTQAAGIGAIQDDEFVRACVEHNAQEMTYLRTEFQRIGIEYVEGFGNFLMTVWASEEKACDIHQKLLEKGVLVRKLGPPLAHCLRISAGRRDENTWLVKNLEAILN
jgi:histidinol-phosphate aminotransferase